METERATYVNHKSPVFFIGLNRFSEFFAGAEFHHVGGLNFDRCAGLRIPSFTGFAAYFLKCAKADQGNLAVLLLQCFGYTFHE